MKPTIMTQTRLKTHHASSPRYAIATNCHFQHNPVVMNLFVHAVMFNYFALVAIHPMIKSALSFTRIFITGIQLVQMFGGTYNQWFVVTQAGTGGYDHTVSQWYTAYFGLIMYAIYIIIFGNFFCEQYIFKKVDTLTKYESELKLKKANSSLEIKAIEDKIEKYKSFKDKKKN